MTMQEEYDQQQHFHRDDDHAGETREADRTSDAPTTDRGPLPEP